jgi:hypothetical protein
MTLATLSVAVLSAAFDLIIKKRLGGHPRDSRGSNCNLLPLIELRKLADDA